MKKKDAALALHSLMQDMPMAERVPGTSAAPLTMRTEQLLARPGQPRKYFAEEALADLAQSVREKGILQPLLVRPRRDGIYEVIAGERRLRAASMAGLTSVPVVVRECTDDEADQLALIENLQRQDLERFEDVSFKLRLIASRWGMAEDETTTRLRRLRKHPEEGPEQVEQLEALFAQIGGEQWPSFVANGLAVLDLPDPLLNAVRTGTLQHSKAVLIARAPSDVQPALLAATVGEGLSFEALRERIAQQRPTPVSSSESAVVQVRKRLTPRNLAKLPEGKKQRAEQLLSELAQLLG